MSKEIRKRQFAVKVSSLEENILSKCAELEGRSIAGFLRHYAMLRAKQLLEVKGTS